MIFRNALTIACWITSSVSFSSFAQLMQGSEIHEDRTVTFRIKAPDANEVKVINKSDEAAMAPSYL